MHSMHVCTSPFCAVCVLGGRRGGEGRRRVEPPTKFDTTLIFRGRIGGKDGGDFFGGEGRQFLHKK